MLKRFHGHKIVLSHKTGIQTQVSMTCSLLRHLQYLNYFNFNPKEIGSQMLELENNIRYISCIYSNGERERMNQQGIYYLLRDSMQ